MAKDLESAVQTQVDATESKPVLLAEFYLDAGTLRFCCAKANIVFPTGGNTYTGVYFSPNNIKTSRGGQITAVDIQFDDIDGTFRTYNASEPFEGKQFILKKIFRDALGASANYIESINGYMEEPKFTKGMMSLRVIDGKTLGRRALTEYYQVACNNVAGDSKCNYDGNFNLSSLMFSGSASGGSVSTLHDSALSGENDYWNFGRIEVTIGGSIYHREIKDYVASPSGELTFDIPLPVSVSPGDSYTIYKGCPKTWDACQATYPFGPEADNKANYNGNIHLLSKDSTASSPSSGYSYVGGGGGYHGGPPQSQK